MTRRLRVCVLTSVHPPLDTRVFHRQAKSMAAAEFDVLMIAPGAPADPVSRVRFASLPEWGGRAGRPLRWPVLMAKALRARADVYHFHDPELLPWGLLLKWISGRPVIYDSHEYLREDILGKHWIPAALRKPVAFISDRIEKWVARHLSAVVVVTEEMATRFAPYQDDVVTVKNLPPSPILPDPLPERQPVVIYAGLMNVERGLDILEETARLVRERHPECEFHILGTVEWHGMPAGSAERSAEDWTARGIHFLGTAPQPEVAGMLVAAACGWLPRSPHAANNLLAWPNKLVEYMVVGLPVVASDLPLQAQVVNDADCGFVVEALSPRAHADAICAVLDDPVEAARLGENGRRVAQEQYTWEGESAKLRSLYLRLVRAR
ncbi:hypothetical protein AYO38_02030 [bacterium SCGC AG-212-C10]|nr:hypothetical protein AYO38_02030 [bacterium SCGC AG-212-C10]